ncbi:disease resistance protein (TIR-NBS-LRR class) [Medicago truncatula]|uniref:ADP-ribosyl cyclase/cyclic ADP-ribose hydrolase n=1 Tax=Medicago truncatula TaxID=3880 RepID=A0A072TQ55_MEDTR|nr:disease resistance protein (TIR-NBS-LRR class) [Medicago truncatula]
MASSSSSSSPFKKHDVFISFRGEDTRTNFTSFLHAALCKNHIETYIDYRIEKGEEVWEELEKAIKASALFLVVFSENYASSTWCLNELVEIMKCKKNDEDNVVVIPVFYRIEASHVRKQTGSYHTALLKQKKQGKDKIQRWKIALFEVANLSGFDSSTYRTEADLIGDIIKAVLQKLNQKYTNELRCLFIPDENYSSIESLLKVDSREVRTIGIWGMGGIGKTTLAAAIFQKVSSMYEGSCFLENVTEESKRHGLSYTYNRLLSKLLGEDLHIETPKVISSMVMKRLKRMKAFIVLDDVRTLELLDNLIGAGHDCLGVGSRVIVTTRDKHVLTGGGIDEIHQVKEMNSQNSIRLFSLNAFKKILPNEGYEEISNNVVSYTKGNPLALKVLGSFLRTKSKKEWNSALNKLKEIPNAEIQKVLRLSYDELDDTEKNIFLDVACFFKGFGSSSSVTKILNACGFFADIGIRNLLDKALVTITSENFIKMHDLIKQMGREIVREESIKNPRQRSRLWNADEICDVLTDNNGTTAVESICLDMDQTTCINLNSNAFTKMPNLKMLAFNDHHQDVMGFNSVHLLEGVDFFPNNLRSFGWSAYPLNSLPSNFSPSNLVELYLPYSNLEKLWNGAQNFPSLERIDLSKSARLLECPNFSNAPNLKHIKLENCESICHVDPSIFNLPKLEDLNVSGCKSLKSLYSSTRSQSFQRLYAGECYNLQEFISMPQNTNDPSTTTTGLTSSTLLIRNLDVFTFPICESLVDLPENFSYDITLSDSKMNDKDTLTTLHKLLPSPCFRIELGTKPLLPADVLENKEEAASDNNDDDGYNYSYNWDTLIKGKICYMLPAGNFKNGDWFHYHSTQTLVSIELPPSDNLGFIFYLVLSQVQSYRIGYHGSFGCECYLETTCGECISIRSFFVDESVLLNPHTPLHIFSDHLFLWYDAQCCKQIMEAVKEIKANDMSAIHNSKLTFKFFARTQDNMEAAIKECGFRWIYSSEGQVVEEEEGCESETSKETHTVEGSESDEQEETVPPAMNFQQSVYGTPNLEAVETKDLRSVLEELLHIGFGGDLML